MNLSGLRKAQGDGANPNLSSKRKTIPLSMCHSLFSLPMEKDIDNDASLSDEDDILSEIDDETTNERLANASEAKETKGL